MSRPDRRRIERAAVKTAKRRKVDEVRIVTAGTVNPNEISAETLSERQIDGYDLWKFSQTDKGKDILLFLPTGSPVWRSRRKGSTNAYVVTCDLINNRDAMVLEYRCQCNDHGKHGVVDCKHIFAERLRRGEVIVIGDPPRKERPPRKASRRAARDRYGADGRPIRQIQRAARKDMPWRVPELIYSLGRAYERTSKGVIIPIRQQKYQGGRKGTPFSTRAMALVAKFSHGESTLGMGAVYERMVGEGTLLLREPPCEDTVSAWVNDERLTPILQHCLYLTSQPFREREIACIIDSSKFSQLMTAHAKEVFYGPKDDRPGAHWMKCHAMVGVETMVVMAADFSSSSGTTDVHDINFLLPLLSQAQKTYPIEALLADKAYLSEEILQDLWERSIKAVIPLKKRWYRDEGKQYHEATIAHVRWFDQNNNRDFQEIYRLRAKVECLFSLMKRLANGFCQSKGRPREVDNPYVPCTAWINETLCKLIYMNLRVTVLQEEETGYKVDYLNSDRRFPAPGEPLIKKRAA
jgi:hypothetical protein